MDDYFRDSIFERLREAQRKANAQYAGYQQQSAYSYFHSGQGFGGNGSATKTPPVDEKAKKIFTLYNGATSEGEKASAEAALNRMGYEVKITTQLIRKAK